MKKYSKGATRIGKHDDHKTYTVDVVDERWFGKIHVFGDKKLRNRIIRLLNGKWKSMKSAPKDGDRIRLKFEDGHKVIGEWSFNLQEWVYNDSFTFEAGQQPIKWRPCK